MTKNAVAKTWALDILPTGLRHSDPNADVFPPTAISGLVVGTRTVNSVQFNWNASTDPSGPIGYEIEVDGALVFTSSAPTFTVTGLGGAQTVSVRVRAKDGVGNFTAWSTAVQGTSLSGGVTPSIWPVQPADSRIHALPRINLHGSDCTGGSGRSPGGSGVDIILINNLANSNTGQAVTGLGNDVYEGTMEYFFRFNNGGRAKIGIDIRSGISTIQKSFSAGVSNWSWWGHFAPNPGHWLRGAIPRVFGGNNVQIWHKRFYVGEDFATPALDQRDAMAIGAPGNVATDFLFVNCSFAWSTDELFDAFYGTTDVGFIYCMFIEPLHVTGHPNADPNGEHGYGPLFGGSGEQGQTLSIERSVFAHASNRAPWVGSRYYTGANNIHYNAAQFAYLLKNQSNHPSNCAYNILNSMFVRGPENGSGLVAVRMGSELYPGGSLLHIGGCIQNGWTNPPNQAGYVSNPRSDMPHTGTLQTVALPSGRLSDLSDILPLAANPLLPTQDEKRAFLDVIEDSVGPMPSLRSLTYGREQLILNQIRNRIDGIADSPQYIDNVAEGGGWPSVPDVLVDPLNPGSEWWAPMPTGASRHTPYASGTFSNGLSRVGYTPMEEWCIEQHWYRGGQ